MCEYHNITGNVEYLLRVEAANLAAYKHFHTDVPGLYQGQLSGHYCR